MGTGGFFDLGEREILVPWDSLQLQTGTGDTTGGQPTGDWDVDIRTHCESGGTTSGTAGTPAGDATAVPNETAGGAQQGTTEATATRDTFMKEHENGI